jgi:pectin methylesterase-like acyl-CoA thioesterase
MDARKAFSYTVLRVIPDVERGELINAGVVLFCPERKYIGARVRLDGSRLRALAPDADVAEIERALASLVAIADGDPAGGALAALPASERFGALSAPSSTTIQPSEVHTGVSEDPERTLGQLFARLV